MSAAELSINSRLVHHRAIVTGAGAGIGRAVALRLSREGAKVIVNDISEDIAEQTASDIKRAGGEAISLAGDVSIADTFEKAFSMCESSWGYCSLLVNNAGIVHQSAFSDMREDDWDRMIAVHLKGCFLGCRRAIGPMLENGSGVIVNMASQLGQIGGNDLVHYSSAKAGIVGLTKALAREVSAKGVRVNAVAPGPINTKLVLALSKDWLESKAKELPMGAFGEPEDVAATVAFLASEDARIYVGQTLGPNSGDVML